MVVTRGRTQSVWQEGESRASRIRVLNELGGPDDVLNELAIFWIDYEGQLIPFGTLPNGGTLTLSTFTTHPWLFRTSSGDEARYAGPSAALHVLPGGRLRVKRLHDDAGGDRDGGATQWGRYRERGRAMGLPVMAYDCVGRAAVSAAERCIAHMLATCRPDVLARLVQFGCRVAIIGRHQVTTDIPEHRFMRGAGAGGGRDVDQTARGLGATRAVPTCSCAEENLTMQGDTRYPSESVLVHELAHAVMNLGFGGADRREASRLYAEARRRGVYGGDPPCYAMENEEEYWAEGTQAWFNATARTDVNSGVCCRSLLLARDPGLAALMLAVYGRNRWLFPDTFPGAFAQQQQQQPGSSRYALRSSRAVDGPVLPRSPAAGPRRWPGAR